LLGTSTTDTEMAEAAAEQAQVAAWSSGVLALDGCGCPRGRATAGGCPVAVLVSVTSTELTAAPKTESVVALVCPSRSPGPGRFPGFSCGSRNPRTRTRPSAQPRPGLGGAVARRLQIAKDADRESPRPESDGLPRAPPRNCAGKRAGRGVEHSRQPSGLGPPSRRWAQVAGPSRILLALLLALPLLGLRGLAAWAVGDDRLPAAIGVALCPELDPHGHDFQRSCWLGAVRVVPHTLRRKPSAGPGALGACWPCSLPVGRGRSPGPDRHAAGRGSSSEASGGLILDVLRRRRAPGSASCASRCVPRRTASGGPLRRFPGKLAEVARGRPAPVLDSPLNQLETSRRS